MGKKKIKKMEGTERRKGKKRRKEKNEVKRRKIRGKGERNCREMILIGKRTFF